MPKPSLKPVEPFIVPVQFNLSLSTELSQRIIKFQREKVFTSAQEVIRIAVADFLKRNGY